MSRIFASLAVLVAGCVTPEQIALMRADGAYQRFSGSTSDGREFKGATWFTFADGEGRYCVVIPQKLDCGGTYDALSDALVLTERFQCGRLGGRVSVERELDRSLGGLTARRGTATLSDGTTATFTYGPVQPYEGQSLCG